MPQQSIGSLPPIPTIGNFGSLEQDPHHNGILSPVHNLFLNVTCSNGTRKTYIVETATPRFHKSEKITDLNFDTEQATVGREWLIEERFASLMHYLNGVLHGDLTSAKRRIRFPVVNSLPIGPLVRISEVCISTVHV